MATGVPPHAREYVKELFTSLLETRSQRQLARALNVRQSGVSVAANEGRTAPKTLRAAAALAGRDPVEVDYLLKKGHPAEPALLAAPTPLGPPPKYPSPESEQTLAVIAFTMWGFPLYEEEYDREAVATLRRLRARLELLREVKALRAKVSAPPPVPPVPPAPPEDSTERS